MHTLLAPSADRPRWRAWVDRYETWNVLVRDHPEFAPRDLRGARASPRRTPPHEVLEELEVRMGAEDASASFM